MPVVNLDTQPHFPAHLIYDPANSVQGANANESLTARVPRIITIENNAAGTDITVQGRVFPDAEWVDIQTVTGATATVQAVTFDPRYNFVKLVRSGAQNVKAYAQA